MTSPVNALGLPSVAVTKICSYLPWEDKINASNILHTWKAGLQTVEAWKYVLYGQELEENIYFLKDKRQKFLVCVKKYGQWFRSVKLSFGHRISQDGLQILNAISRCCDSMKSFYISQEVEDQTDGDYVWKKPVVYSICCILERCKYLQSCCIIRPIIDWSESSENNIILSLLQKRLAGVVTHLELTSLSLFNLESHCTVIKNFTGLRYLILSREKMNNALLLHLVNSGLQELTLVQEEEILFSQDNDLKDDIWTQIITKCPAFRVDLIMRYVMVRQDVFAPKMPLRALILDDLVNVVTKGVIDHIIASFKFTLEKFTYSNFLLENFEVGYEIIPSALVTMAQECSQLRSLVYGFPLSSTTLLLLAKSRKFEQIIIPEFEVSYEFDWPEENFSPNEVLLLKKEGHCAKCLEHKMSELLGQKWRMYDRRINLNDIIYE